MGWGRAVGQERGGRKGHACDQRRVKGNAFCCRDETTASGSAPLTPQRPISVITSTSPSVYKQRKLLQNTEHLSSPSQQPPRRQKRVDPPPKRGPHRGPLLLAAHRHPWVPRPRIRQQRVNPRQHVPRVGAARVSGECDPHAARRLQAVQRVCVSGQAVPGGARPDAQGGAEGGFVGAVWVGAWALVF